MFYICLSPIFLFFLPPQILLFCSSHFFSFSLSKILYFIFIIYFYVSSFICLFHISLEIKESVQELGADNFCKRRRIFIYSSNKTSFAFIGFGKCALQLQSVRSVLVLADVDSLNSLMMIRCNLSYFESIGLFKLMTKGVLNTLNNI